MNKPFYSSVIKPDIFPKETIVSIKADSLFQDYERKAFLRQHLGGGNDKSLRWGNQADCATCADQEANLKLVQQGKAGAKVTSYWETNDGRWLQIITEVDIDVLVTVIDAGTIGVDEPGSAADVHQGITNMVQEVAKAFPEMFDEDWRSSLGL